MNHPSDDELEHHRREIRALAAALPERPLQARTTPAAPGAAAGDGIERERSAYAIGELTDPHHRAFVDGAFRALLKRAPAPDEAEAQLRLLGRGTSKAEILGNLRWSAEGRRGNVRVHGLLPRYVAAKARRIPLLGTLLDWLLALAALPLLARHQRATDAMVAAGAEAIARRTSALEELAGQLHRYDEHLRQRIDDLHGFAHELALARDALAGTLTDVATSLRTRIERLETGHELMGGKLDELAMLRQRLQAFNHWSHHLGEAFNRIESTLSRHGADAAADAAPAALRAVAADTARTLRQHRWAGAFTALLPRDARVLALAAGADWSALLAAGGYGVVCAEAVPALAATQAGAEGVAVEPVEPMRLLRRTTDASFDGASVLALPLLLSRTPLPEVLAELGRCLLPGAPLLLAWAREPALLLATLLAPLPVVADAVLVEQALLAAGFTDVRRVDAHDGTPALLARRAGA